MLRGLIDLHTHTLYSDGSVTPSRLLASAANAGAVAVAITDHDTVAGLAEARETADRLGIELVKGTEISAEYSPGTMHILGYDIDDHSPALLTGLDDLKEARGRRNPDIAARLQELGLDVEYDEVVELAGNDMVGRPHFAQVMVRKGIVSSIQEAFDRFLAKGAPAYVEKKRLSPADSISLIHSAGGVAVLAHPYQLRLGSSDELETLVDSLRGLGLDGIEAIYSRHTPEQRESYKRLAERRGLIVTGGSDFHGAYKPDINIVTGLGDLRVSYPLLEQLKARVRQVRMNQTGNTQS